MADEQKHNDPVNPASAGGIPAEAGNDLAATLKDCEAKRDEYLNGWKRAQADFINYKKDESRRLQEATQYAKADVISDILPALDSFGFALSTIDKESSAYRGVVMIQGQLLDALKRKGLEKIAVVRGDTFDPNKHEAMMEVELPPDDPDRNTLVGKIVEELVPGYVMNGKVIRATKVKLAK
jgi:molecular chaperone GrpE